MLLKLKTFTVFRMRILRFLEVLAGIGIFCYLPGKQYNVIELYVKVASGSDLKPQSVKKH